MHKQPYDSAQTLMHGIFTKTVAFNTTIFPIWIGDSHCFWYERENKAGKEYRLVDAKYASNEIAFDHDRLATILAGAARHEVDAKNLPIHSVRFELNPSVICFTAFNKRWHYSLDSETCLEIETANEDCVVSPNGQQGIFIRDFNLWCRDLDNGNEHALTYDGEEDYVYGVGISSIAPNDYKNAHIRWSPDSRQIFTVQRDTRQVKNFPVIHHVPQDGSIRPQVVERKLALPGDINRETLSLLAIDVETGSIQEAHYRPIPRTRSVLPFFDSNLGWWSTDSRQAYFVDVARDYKAVRVVEFDTQTGATKILFEETSKTFISLMHNCDEPPAFVPLPDTGELLWYSERSGRAHLYLYNMETGQLKNPITEGHWLVRDVVHVDAQRREVFVQTAGRNTDRDPYFRDLCRIHLDTGAITPLIDSDHEVWAVTQRNQNTMMAIDTGRDVSSAFAVASSGDFAVVTRSRADEAPSTLLLDRESNIILTVENADTSTLPDNWQWPEPVKLLAADGKTDIYGLVFRPSNFSPEQSYPIISHVYNSPDLAWVSKGSFTNGVAYGMPYLDAAALAALGFIVVQIDGRGSPCRHKQFLDECYGWTESASAIEDHVAGIQQLAKRYPYMDISRMGISSHCAGGMGVVSSLCQQTSFYKVGVASMTYDSRFLSAPLWGDKYESLSGPNADHQYPEQLVDNLQGKLLLLNNMVDSLAPSEGTLRIINALQTANKDFDMVLLPNPAHGYLIRCAWDYFVEHLLDMSPPKDFLLTTVFD